MSTEAVIVIIAVAVVLITLLGWMAGRAENRRALDGETESAFDYPAAAAPGYANEAAYAQAAREAEQSLRSERDIVLGDDDRVPALHDEERDVTGRFAREDRVPRGL